MEFQIVKKGEKAQLRDDRFEDGKAVVQRTVKPNDEATDRYVVEWTFDYSTCTETEKLELMTRSAVIDAQREFRKACQQGDPDPEEWAQRTVNVHDYMNRERTRTKLPKKLQAARLLEDMPEEERAELIAKYTR